MQYYILDGKNAVACTFDKYMDWLIETKQLTSPVAQTDVGKTNVSTVFLGLDHNHFGGKPLIFETMVFGGKHDLWQDRYSTWEEAAEGHERIVRMVRDPCSKTD